MRPFRAILAQENIETGDGRIFDPGSISWRPLPLTLLAQIETPAFGGHEGAFVLGRIDEITRDGDSVVATGELDDEGTGPEADRRRDTIRQIESSTLNGVSVDPGAVEVEWECLETVDDVDWGEICVRELQHFTAYEIGAATVVTVPALDGTLIEITGDSTSSEPAAGAPAMAAAGTPLAVPELPPAEWFDDPRLDRPTPLTISDDGRVFGHIATWGTCHIGYEARCVEPPRSLSNYAYFRTGSRRVTCDECPRAEVATGALTLDTGHADLALDARLAAAHYDDTGTAFADVAAGEDEFGVWVAGALRSGVTVDVVERARASSPSGDWRRIGGSLELVAVLNVNVPGFPVPRELVAAGEPLALVAAGARRGRPARAGVARSSASDQLGARVSAVENELRFVRSLFTVDEVADRLRARMRPAS